MRSAGQSIARRFAVCLACETHPPRSATADRSPRLIPIPPRWPLRARRATLNARPTVTFHPPHHAG